MEGKRISEKEKEKDRKRKSERKREKKLKDSVQKADSIWLLFNTF